MRPFSAFLIVLTGSAMNSVNQLQHDGDPYTPILAGLVFGTVCVGLNDLTQQELGTMLALLYLLGSSLTSGVAIIETLTNISESN